jgi:hypothetical protein
LLNSCCKKDHWYTTSAVMAIGNQVVPQHLTCCLYCRCRPAPPSLPTPPLAPRHPLLQTNQTVVEIKNLFETIGRDFPNLNPKFFVDTLGRLLEQLLEDTIGQAGTFESLASFTDVQKLSNALPGVLDAVTTAVPELQGLALQQLPAPFVGKGPGSEALRQIDQVTRVQGFRWTRGLGV